MMKIALFLATSLVMACIFFTARVLAGFIAEDYPDYNQYAVWALLMGVISTALDRPIKKWLEGHK